MKQIGQIGNSCSMAGQCPADGFNIVDFNRWILQNDKKCSSYHFAI